MSINRVSISGNLTRDSELRVTQGGTAVLGFGVAVNDRRKNPQTGEWEDVPNYVDCALFGKRADSLAGYLTKGTKVAVDGKLRYSSWERDGQRRSKLEVIVDEIEFMSRAGDSKPKYSPQVAQTQQTPAYGYSAANSAQQAATADTYDDDIPF